MDGVSLRFPRPVIVTVAIGVAVAWAALGSVPALADQVRQGEWWLGALHITQAQQTTEGAGVTIALLDTGVDPAQPDIAGSVITGPDYTGTGEKPGSRFYGIHGTAMASLIVGHGHGPGGADGILGVAPAAKLLSVRVGLDGDDPLLADPAIVGNLPGAIAQGIRYAVEAGAQVIDLPLDPGQSPSALVASTAPAPGRLLTPTELAERAAAGGSPAEQSAVAYALSKGVVLVAPGGDNGTGTDEPNFPADYPGVISVGAFNSSFIKAPFSSHRPYVTLTAAGSGMTAAVPSGYAKVSSTAAASAVVTGIVALIKSEYPALTPAQVTQALTSSTVFRPANGLTDGSGHGTADAAAALAAAQKIAGPVSRAGAGAVAATQPATPPVPFVDQALAPKIKRDGLISGALLAVLLVPIIFAALVSRRRRKARRALLAEPAPAVRIPYGVHSGDSSADPMMQYFTAVPAEPGSAREPGVPVGTGQPAMARGSSSARGNGNFGGAFGEPPPPGAPGQQGDDAPRAGQFARSPIAPLRRALARPPKVSGTPPWEPAPKPDTELPWASSPPLPRRTPVPMPAVSASGAAASGAAGAAGAAGRADAGTADVWAADGGAALGEAAGDADGGAVGDAIWGPAAPSRVPAAESGAANSDGGFGPIYVWNPGASTETFPSVPSTRRSGAEAPEPPSED
jgi:subtilisin family serine protease